MAIKSKLKAKTIRVKSTAKSASMTFKKIAVHGPAGMGKTTLAATLAGYNPIVILTEKTGEESLQPVTLEKVFGAGRSDILYDIPYIEAYEPTSFEAAVNFAMGSPDYDTIVFDSFSKASRLILKQQKKDFADGRKAYGEHNDQAIGLLETLMGGDKHCVFLCHTTRIEDGETGELIYSPSFEGKAFAEKFCYELAHVLYLDSEMDETGASERVLRCHQGDSDRFAKNRGGLLKELEVPHLARIIYKLQGGIIEDPVKSTKKKKTTK